MPENPKDTAYPHRLTSRMQHRHHMHVFPVLPKAASYFLIIGALKRCSFYLWDTDVLIMDETERTQFKGKFTVLVVILNILIFAAAAAIIVFFLVPDSIWLKIPIVILCIAIFIISIAVFIPKYRATKAWLDVHGTTKEERLAQMQKEQEEYRARIRAELEEEMREEESASKNVEK